MPTDKKIEIVSEVREKFNKASGIYFTDYLGLNVTDITDLRKKFYAEGIEYLIVKNTLANIASKSLEIEGVDDIFAGPTAIAFTYEDPTSPARVLKEFKKDHDLPELKAFVFEGKLMDKSSFIKIANLPSKEVLLSVLLSGLNSPMSKVAATLSSPMMNLVNVLNSLKETKQA